MFNTQQFSDLLQVLWWLNSLLLALLIFLIKNYVNGFNKKLESKQDKSVCKERYPKLDAKVETLYKHKHPINCNKDETGSVIIP